MSSPRSGRIRLVRNLSHLFLPQFLRNALWRSAQHKRPIGRLNHPTVSFQSIGNDRVLSHKQAPRAFFICQFCPRAKRVAAKLSIPLFFCIQTQTERACRIGTSRHGRSVPQKNKEGDAKYRATKNTLQKKGWRGRHRRSQRAGRASAKLRTSFPLYSSLILFPLS